MGVLIHTSNCCVWKLGSPLETVILFTVCKLLYNLCLKLLCLITEFNKLIGLEIWSNNQQGNFMLTYQYKKSWSSIKLLSWQLFYSDDDYWASTIAFDDSKCQSGICSATVIIIMIQQSMPGELLYAIYLWSSKKIDTYKALSRYLCKILCSLIQYGRSSISKVYSLHHLEMEVSFLLQFMIINGYLLNLCLWSSIII